MRRIISVVLLVGQQAAAKNTTQKQDTPLPCPRHDVDGDGTVTREEFLQCMEALHIELTKFELNVIFWTLDPDKSGHLTYQEFSRAFFDRRNRQKKKPKRLKPHWTPNNPSEARQSISKGRKNCVNASTPYAPRTVGSMARVSDSSSHIAGTWHVNSKQETKKSIQTNVFLHSKTADVISTEKTMTKIKSSQNLERLLVEHERGRTLWKKENPDWEKKKYVIYI